MHLIADHVADISDRLMGLGHPLATSMDPTQGRADEARQPTGDARTARARHPRDQANVLFPSRDFH